VIDKIKGEASEEFEQMFPEKQPSKVVIKTKDGKEYSEYLEYPKGDPREPMTEDDLTSKFNGLATGLISESRMNEIKSIIFSCENMSCKDMMKELIA